MTCLYHAIMLLHMLFPIDIRISVSDPEVSFAVDLFMNRLKPNAARLASYLTVESPTSTQPSNWYNHNLGFTFK